MDAKTRARWHELWSTAICQAQEAYGLHSWSLKILVVNDLRDEKGCKLQAETTTEGRRATLRFCPQHHWLPVTTLAFHEMYHVLRRETRGVEESLACAVSQAIERALRFRFPSEPCVDDTTP